MTAHITDLAHGPFLLAEHGQKATLLARGLTLGESVPAGFVISAGAAPGLPQDAELAARLEQALLALACERVAVRSSPSLSLPGALETVLDVPAKAADVLAAIGRVLASGSGASACDQLAARGLSAPTTPWCAVLVQRYVEARADDAVGLVVCTRHPTTGEPGPIGEYLERAGAHEVVSGRSRPRALTRAEDSLERTNPALFERVVALAVRLERAFDEPLELELVHDAGVLWLLQIRPLVLSPRAQARLALDAIESDAPSYPALLRRLIDEALPALVESRLPPPERIDPARHVARGLAASPGVGRGVLVIDLESALERARSESVVLARRDAVPEDVAAFRAAKAVFTTSGGLTSHAAVIARGLRVPAVVGASQVRIDVKERCLVDPLDPKRVLVREGERVTLDAHRGHLFRGDIEPEPSVAAPELARLLGEARKLRRVSLWVHAPLELARVLRARFELDGCLCPFTGDLPRPDAEAPGKDVWLELPAERALSLLPEVPAGYGVVLRGTVDDALLREVRAVARLRALGVEASGARGISEPVDLVLVQGDFNVSQLAVRGPKQVRLVDSSADYASAGHEAGGILACDASKALRFALGLACVGRV